MTSSQRRKESSLSIRQVDLLRRLVQSEKPVPPVELDGRVLNALSRRGLAEVTGTGARPTESGRDYFLVRVRKRRRVQPRSAAARGRTDQAEAILQAIGILEQALPRRGKLLVGDLLVDAAELLSSLEAFAKQLDPESP